MLTAVLTSPANLSRLTDAEWNLVRDRARAAPHPQQQEMQQNLRKALDELRGGILPLHHRLEAVYHHEG
jgi:hypothetical protein